MDDHLERTNSWRPGSTDVRRRAVGSRPGRADRDPARPQRARSSTSGRARSGEGAGGRHVVHPPDHRHPRPPAPSRPSGDAHERPLRGAGGPHARAASPGRGPALRRPRPEPGQPAGGHATRGGDGGARDHRPSPTPGAPSSSTASGPTPWPWSTRPPAWPCASAASTAASSRPVRSAWVTACASSPPLPSRRAPSVAWLGRRTPDGGCRWRGATLAAGVAARRHRGDEPVGLGLLLVGQPGQPEAQEVGRSSSAGTGPGPRTATATPIRAMIWSSPCWSAARSRCSRFLDVGDQRDDRSRHQQQGAEAHQQALAAGGRVAQAHLPDLALELLDSVLLSHHDVSPGGFDRVDRTHC